MQRWYVRLFNILIDDALKGVGPDVTYLELSAAFPWLANAPTRWLVDQLFVKLDERVKELGDLGLIRLGYDFYLSRFNQSIAALRDGQELTPGELQKIKDDFDSIINRGGSYASSVMVG